MTKQELELEVSKIALMTLSTAAGSYNETIWRKIKKDVMDDVIATEISIEKVQPTTHMVTTAIGRAIVLNFK